MQEIFDFLNEIAPECAKCKEKQKCKAVRVGFYNDVIAVFECGCGKEQMIYRGLDAGRKKTFEEIIGPEAMAGFRNKQKAATNAEMKCPICGKEMRYIESMLGRDGKLLHRFDCRNSGCKDYEKSIWIELTEKDCERIEEKAKERGKCLLCGKLYGAKVMCPKEKGLICEKHCIECEHHDHRTSKFICRF